jgi:hypothetical protein
MLWLVLIGALLPALLNGFVEWHQLSGGGTLKWPDYFQNDLFLMTMLMCPALFALIVGYVFAREFQERTVNPLLTGPRPRYQVLFAKFIIVIPALVSVLLLSFLMTWGSGFLFKHQALNGQEWATAIGRYGLLLVIQFALAPISAMASLFGRSYIPAMGLGLFAVISELTIMQSKYIMYYPWSAPMNLVLNFSPEYNDTTTGVLTLLIAFAIPLLALLAYFQKTDVHSG